MNRKLFLVGAVRVAVVMSSMFFVGCESNEDSDDNEGILFSNESSHTVTVILGYYVGIATPNPTFIETERHTLEPGERMRPTEPALPGLTTIYYQYTPTSTVRNQQISDSEVIFVDR
jgi:hypothetical protein